jgi:hypothetical protein
MIQIGRRLNYIRGILRAPTKAGFVGNPLANLRRGDYERAK